MNNSEKIRLFELGAAKKGYYFDRDIIDNKYVDQFLQEAWEINCLVESSRLDEISKLKNEVNRLRLVVNKCVEAVTNLDSE